MKESSTDKIFNSLVKDIFEGRIKPGQRLIEMDLADQYGFSRGPLREVLRKLEAKRLIKIELNIGARVVDLSAEEISQLYFIREALEGMSARLAAKNMPKAEIVKLQSILDGNRKNLSYPNGYVTLFERENIDFHQRIVMGSKNKRLAEFLFDDLYYILRLYRRKVSPSQRFIHATDQHIQILSAIGNRDGELAEILMRRHIQEARIALLSSQSDIQTTNEENQTNE